MVFEFEAWCKEYELNEDTRNALLDKGYNSYKSLRLLSSADVPKMFGKLLLPAQIGLLLEGVSILRPEAPSETPTETLTPPVHANATQPPPAEPERQAQGTERGVNVQELLQMCGLGGPPLQEVAEGELYPTDPYGFGKGSFANKHRDVGNYVSSLPTMKEEGAAITVGGISFTMAPDKRVKQDKLKMAQYSEGSLTILRAMIIDDHMPTQRILDYVNYLIQISRFAQTFAWPAVLNFDAIYRKQQSELGFRWGTSSPTLMQTQLRTDPQPGPKAHQHIPNVKDPHNGRTICQKWNGRRGCDFPGCTYAHVCRVCFSPDHRQYQHGERPSAVPTKN